MPITFSMIHNDTEVRVVFSWGNGSSQLDMSFDDYASLPKITDVKWTTTTGNFTTQTTHIQQTHLERKTPAGHATKQTQMHRTPVTA